MLLLSVAAAPLLVAVIVWYSVIELPTTASTAIVAVAACFALDRVCRNAAGLVHEADWMSVESAAVNAVTAAVKVLVVHV